VDNRRVYVSSIRDRALVVLNLSGSSASLIARLSLPRNANSMALGGDQTTLYVSQDHSDSVAVIDTGSSAIIPPEVVPNGTHCSM
jgi:YVTN family beta-propeller protein